MDDVRRALEEAAEAVIGVQTCGASVCVKCDAQRARAAVLAFLNEMPAMTGRKVSTGNGRYTYTPEGWNLHTLAAAIEKERT